LILRHAFIPLDNIRLAHLCGSLDEHLRSIESAFDVSISRRNESFRIEGAKADAERAVALLQTLYLRPSSSPWWKRWPMRRAGAGGRSPRAMPNAAMTQRARATTSCCARAAPTWRAARPTSTST
jgi:phosphate starvation-inducible PhoH-like protein